MSIEEDTKNAASVIKMLTGMTPEEFLLARMCEHTADNNDVKTYTDAMELMNKIDPKQIKAVFINIVTADPAPGKWCESCQEEHEGFAANHQVIAIGTAENIYSLSQIGMARILEQARQEEAGPQPNAPAPSTPQ